MPISGEDLLDAAELLAQEKNFMVAVKYSLAGGALAGMTTVAGGLMFGPIGLAVGGFGGGLLGYAASKDKFKPLHEVIANDLTHAQRTKLIQHLRSAVQNVDITDAAMLVSLVMSDSNFQASFITSLISFAEKELHYSIRQ